MRTWTTGALVLQWDLVECYVAGELVHALVLCPFDMEADVLAPRRGTGVVVTTVTSVGRIVLSGSRWRKQFPRRRV